LAEGWNKGWDTYNFNFTESYPDFDLETITKYAASKNVTIIGHHETDGKIENYESQINEAFALYEKNGVHTIKTGYVGSFLDGKERHSSQFGVRHFRKVIELAAKHEMMIDNHEPVMPTGLQRTYPNLMTQEGVRGQEWDAWSVDGGNPPDHTTIIPFTRGLAGPMDFTPVTFNFTNTALPSTRVQTTLAKQLALFVVLYSPLQMASDMIENYEKNPEPFEFITSCPTNWAKTIVPHASIGNYITIARKDRDTENWFIGSITNAEGRELSLPLDFLDKGSTYSAKIYKDGIGADFKTNPYPVAIEEMKVTAETILNLKLAPGGGTAIKICKLK
jgi:alpha-glucosidase